MRRTNLAAPCLLPLSSNAANTARASPRLLPAAQVGGSIPERCDGRLYNTCFVYGRDGRLLGRHRKVGACGTGPGVLLLLVCCGTLLACPQLAVSS